jgi:hypothetical protein
MVSMSDVLFASKEVKESRRLHMSGLWRRREVSCLTVTLIKPESHLPFTCAGHHQQVLVHGWGDEPTPDCQGTQAEVQGAAYVQWHLLRPLQVQKFSSMPA